MELTGVLLGGTCERMGGILIIGQLTDTVTDAREDGGSQNSDC